MLFLHDADVCTLQAEALGDVICECTSSPIDSEIIGCLLYLHIPDIM